VLRARLVTPLGPGDSVRAKIFADFKQDRPNYFLLRPEDDTTWAIRYSQPQSDLSARLRLVRHPTGDVLFELSDTTGARKGALDVSLEDGALYVLIVQQGLLVSVGEDVSLLVNIAVDEASNP
jgi:hypothetical protein